ncbi:NACHT, LRR and PYD domains-containing protein 13 [Actinomortierella ambigua]|nr:NACHT, LRR and PYD domains-containing protein 13 [Actinomortierella ambigua]
MPSTEDDALYTQLQLQLHLQEAQLEEERHQLEYSLLHHSQQQQQQNQHSLSWTPSEPSFVSATMQTPDLSSTASGHSAIFNQAQPPLSSLLASSSTIPSLVAQDQARTSMLATHSTSTVFMPSVHTANGLLASEQVFHTHDNPSLNNRCNITLPGTGTGTNSGARTTGDFDAMTDCDEAQDEDYLPPSELKYILYEDHVSPITIQEALVVLNDHLHDLRVLDQSADHDASQFGCEGGGAGDLWDPAIGYAEDESDLSYLDLLGVEQDEDEDDEECESADKEDDGSAVNSEANKQLSPSPIATAGGAYPFPSVSGTDSQAFRNASNPYSGTRLTTTSTGGSPTSTQQQPDRSRARKDPDILLNLAGQILTPDHIHDLYFSRHYSRLVHLNLYDTNLGTWGAQAVGGLLAERTCRIQYLNLGRNWLGFEGMLQLFGMYKNHSLILVRLKKHKASNICRLDLSHNDINDVGCISIAKILVGTTIQHLNLSFNQISDWGASTILHAFTESRKTLSLEGLVLEANRFTFAGGVDMCKMLAFPQSRVRHLDLRGAKVTDVGVPYLTEALRSHSCVLHTLNMYDCQLTDTGVLKLAVTICANTSLRVLGLGANAIGDRGIAALAQCLCLNNRLEELDISDNEASLSRVGVETLLATIQGNCSLLSLMIDSDPDSIHHNHHHHQHHHHSTLHGSAATNGNLFDVYLEEESDDNAGEVGDVINGSNNNSNNGLGLASATHATTTSTSSTTATAAGEGGNANLMGGTPAETEEEVDEQAIAQERRRFEQAMTRLKSYVRLNHKRTMRLRSQCFETLVCARILIYGQDGNPDASTLAPESQRTTSTTITEEVVRVHHGHKMPRNDARDKGPTFIPSNTGLPTPPLSGGAESAPTNPISSASATIPAATAKAQGDEVPDLPVTPDGEYYTFSSTNTTVVAAPSPTTRPSLVRLPWEIQEAILFCLDEDRVLTRNQFHAILRHATDRWDTVRQPWERWGDVREAILEQTGCYYYSYGSEFK